MGIPHLVQHPGPPDRNPSIWTRGLSRRYGAVVAVDGLDLRVLPGEVYGFLGPNGAGKSTCVRMLCTLLRPSAGTALVAGYDVARDPGAVRRRIGVALQEAALDDRQTGRELLSLQARLYGLGRRAVRRRLDEILDLVAIGGALDRRIGSYSGGMKRRVDLAAALVHGPEILFLDEPTTGLDPGSRAALWAEIRRLNAELAVTIFLTTQYLEEADALAGRVGIFAGGRLVAEGPPGALKRSLEDDVIEYLVEGDDPGALERLLGLDGVHAVTRDGGRVVVRTPDAETTLQRVAEAMATTGFRVVAVSVQRATLDDVFQRLTGPQVTLEPA
jgi:ABC-2 type transport system ATP-binding protein